MKRPGPHRGGELLEGCRALVTGASSGIGAAVALTLASTGAHLAISGRDTAALKRHAQALDAARGAHREAREAQASHAARRVRVAAGGGGMAGAGGTALAAPEPARDAATVSIVADLRRRDAAAEVVEAAVAGLNGLDVVVSNAGIGWAGPMTEMTPAEIDDLVDLNLRAPLHLARAALPYLCRQGRGHLVFVGSVAGRLGVPREAAYSATKAGVSGLADALRSELAGTGVRVSLVTPGAVDTAFFERRNRPYERIRPRPVPPTAVAAAVLDCLRRERAEATVPAWVEVPVRLHGAFPRLYRVLAARFA